MLCACMQAMLDCGGKVELTADEFLTAAATCMTVEAAAQKQELAPDIVKELEALSAAMAKDKVKGIQVSIMHAAEGSETYFASNRRGSAMF